MKILSAKHTRTHLGDGLLPQVKPAAAVRGTDGQHDGEGDCGEHEESEEGRPPLVLPHLAIRRGEGEGQ